MTGTDEQTRLPDSTTRLPALDGMRGIAILLVLFYHFGLYGGMRSDLWVDRVVHRIMTAGWIGVDVFFVLSGFLITGILHDSRGSEHPFRTFYLRRTLRIFPLYYGFLAFFFFVAPQLKDFGEDFEALRSGQLWYWSYLVNVDVSLNGWPKSGYIGHFWSLAVEEQFYLVWPFVVLSLGHRKLRAVCLGCVVGALAFRLAMASAGQQIAAYVLTPSRIDALALGGLVALWGRSPVGYARLRRWGLPVLLASLLLCGTYFLVLGRFSSEDPLVYTLGLSVVAVAAAAAIALAVTQPDSSPLVRLLSQPLLRFFGFYSYALYVLHHPVLTVLRRSGWTVNRFPTVFESQLPAQALFCVIGGLLSVVAALLSWYLWESRFLALKRRFPYTR